MEQFYLRNEDKQIYAVYHEPRISENNKTGIILCYPIGQEYIRCHKSYVILANNLAAIGFHVLRFDYTGTGDSSGCFENLTIVGCLSDINIAVSELKQICNVTKIVLIGVRLGATLAFQYSKNHIIDKLILWNPVFDGKEFLSNISKEYNKWLSGSFTSDTKKMRGTVQSFGYSYSPVLKKAIEVLNLNVGEIGIKCLLIADNEKNVSKVNSFLSVINSINKEFWVKRDDERIKSLVPVHEINIITEWLSEKVIKSEGAHN